MTKEIKIRFANEKDVDAIYKIGMHSKEFAVSKIIRFYKKEEIAQWVKDKKNDVIILATDGSMIVGFACCKIMTKDWAMVDNFYILPEFRRMNIGTKVEKFLEKELKKRKITYITRLVKPNHKTSRKFLKKRGFKEHYKYIWIDKLL